MTTRDFVPTRLPVLSDAALLHTLFEYRYALQMLTAGVSRRVGGYGQRRSESATGSVERTVLEVIGALEAEIRGRGLDTSAAEVERFLSDRSPRRPQRPRLEAA